MTKKHTKFAAILLLFSFVLTLASCSVGTPYTSDTSDTSDNPDNSDTSGSQKESEDTESSSDESQSESESESESEKPTETDSTDLPSITKHTVSFDMNFENSPSLPALLVNSGEKADIPPPPVREGFIFSGWFFDKTCSSLFDFSEKIESDITLYALWRGEEYIKNTEEKQAELSAIAKLNEGKIPKITLNENGSANFILGCFSSIRVTDFSSALASLESIKALWGFEDLEHEYIFVGQTESINATHLRLQQISGGYFVHGKQLIISTDKAGKVTSLVGDYAPQSEKFKSAINVSRADAAELFSKNHFGIPLAYDGARIIYRLDGCDEYAYLFDKGATSVIISAFDGRIIDSYSNIMFALPTDSSKITPSFGREQATSTDVFPTVLYEFLESNEKTFFMHDPMRNITYHDLAGKSIDTSLPLWEYEYYNTPTICDDDNVWNSPEGSAAAKLSLTLSEVYDFYFDLLGPNFLGEGVRILAFINDGSLGTGNAFCSPILNIDGVRTVIISFAPGEISFGTVSHELSHAIHNALSPGLCKSEESGAIAESFAYVMSNLISIEKHGYADWSAIRTFPTESDIHSKSLAISRVLYKIYRETEDAKTAAELLCNVWNYITDTSSFASFRNAILATANELGLEIYEKAELEFGNEGMTFATLEDGIFGTLKLSVGEFSGLSAISNVRISVTPNNMTQAIQLFSDAEGSANISLGFGIYTLEVEVEGYKKEKISFSVLPKKETSLRLELKPLFITPQPSQNS